MLPFELRDPLFPCTCQIESFGKEQFDESPMLLLTGERRSPLAVAELREDLIQVPGTPLYGLPDFSPLELVRTVAAARLVMPASVVRLSAGRASMSEELHALCFRAGASSIFLGERLLTAENNGNDEDRRILEQLDATLKV